MALCLQSSALVGWVAEVGMLDAYIGSGEIPPTPTPPGREG
jgi:hypothetical protein